MFLKGFIQNKLKENSKKYYKTLKKKFEKAQWKFQIFLLRAFKSLILSKAQNFKL